MDLATKKDLLKKLILELENDLERAQLVAKDSRDAAINEESKPENEYDTRAIEASYLAGAQAHRARELEAQIQILRLTEPRLFTNNSTIDATALVRVLHDKDESWFFMLPQGGGKVLKWGSKAISILTPQSPLAQEILGLRVGDTAFLQKKDRVVEVEILSIY